MMRDPVFVDTVALVALSSARDSLHVQALEQMKIYQQSGLSLITSEWVLSEYLASASAPRSRRVVVGVIEALRASAQVKIVEASHSAWENAYRLYSERLDKAWSHVDCASIQTCQELGIRRVFTKDHHFAQAGLQVLLR